MAIPTYKEEKAKRQEMVALARRIAKDAEPTTGDVLAWLADELEDAEDAFWFQYLYR